MSFPLIVFDLDGTLVDSRQDITDSANLLLEACGGSPLPEPTISGMVGEGAGTLVARAFEAAGLDAPADALARFLDIYDRRLLAHTQAYAGTAEVLAALASRTTLAVLTNKPLAATREILAGLDLAKYFSQGRIFGGDGPLPRKPEPDGLLRLAADAGVPISRTLLVGDSLIDWRTAKNAGTRVCLARYGFGFPGIPAGRLGPDDLVIDAPTALLDL